VYGARFAGRGIILLLEELHFEGGGPWGCNLLLKTRRAQNRPVTLQRKNSAVHFSALIAYQLSSLPSRICETPVSETQGIEL